MTVGGFGVDGGVRYRQVVEVAPDSMKSHG